MSRIPIYLTLAGICWGISDANAQHWYKGNMHTHSLWSDGDDFPESIARWYKTNGYNFIAVTDHNRLQAGENWRTVPSGYLTKEIFEKYLNNFGPSVDKQEQGGAVKVRLKTLAEYQDQYNEAGRFLLLNGEEITSHYSGQPVHVNAINIKEVVPRQFGNNISEILQHAVNGTLHQRESTGQPMFAIINHPNFGRSFGAAEMMRVQNARFFEVHNGGFPTGNYGDEYHDSTEVIWDKVNLHNVQLSRPLLFGVGNDDTHNYHQMGGNFHNPGRSWVMVNAPSLDATSLVRAMEAGNFYVSTGVILKELVSSEKRIQIRIEAEQGVHYTIQFIGVRQGENKASILKTVTGTEGEFKIGSEILFVRAKILSSKLQKNPYAAGDYETAWTQPVSRYAAPYLAD